VKQNEIALGAARQRYTEGVIDFLNVITTQAQLLQTQNDLADNDTQIASDLVSLYRALGGGWDVVDYPWRPPRPRQSSPAAPRAAPSPRPSSGLSRVSNSASVTAAVSAA